MNAQYSQYWISAGLILSVIVVFMYVFLGTRKTKKKPFEEYSSSLSSDFDNLSEVMGISDQNITLVLGKGMILAGKTVDVTLRNGKVVPIEKEKILVHKIPLGENTTVHVMALQAEGPWDEFSIDEKGMLYILGPANERHPGLVRAWQDLGRFAKNPKAELSEASKIVFAKNGWTVTAVKQSSQVRKK